MAALAPRNLVGPNSIHNDSGEVFYIAEFPITQSNFDNFMRGFPLPMDCVINAMSIIGLLGSNVTADICRIFSNNRGLKIEQILSFFRYTIPRQWDYINITFASFVHFVNHSLKRNHVSFCGFYVPGSYAHAWLIGKDSNDDIFYIDPHIPNGMCSLVSDPNCMKYLESSKPGTLYYILCSNPIM
jgi:hypothetical protein